MSAYTGGYAYKGGTAYRGGRGSACKGQGGSAYRVGEGLPKEGGEGNLPRVGQPPPQPEPEKRAIPSYYNMLFCPLCDRSDKILDVSGFNLILLIQSSNQLINQHYQLKICRKSLCSLPFKIKVHKGKLFTTN